MFSKYQELIAQTNKLQEELAEIEVAAFDEGAKEIFQKHPELNTFSWIQYAPSFNDGDPCYFSVYRDPFINGYDSSGESDGTEEEDEEEQEWEFWKERREKLAPLYTDVTTFLQLVSDDSLERMFGDSSRIIIRRDQKPEVDSYYDWRLQTTTRTKERNRI